MAIKISTQEKNYKSNPDSPIFVIGMPRSGTTVLSEAISVHEDLGWISNYISWMPLFPELAIISRILDLPCLGHQLRGKKTQDKNFLSFIRRFLPFSAEAYPVWDRYCVKNFSTDYLKGISASLIERERVISLINKIMKCQGKKRFFSKLTGPPRLNYLQSIFPNAYFIHVIRDPRANISSLLKVSFWKKNEGYKKPWWENGLSAEAMDEWKSYGKSPVALCAVQWREIVETTWAEKKSLCNNKYIELRYEDFVSNPMLVLNRILNQVKLKQSINVSRYVNSIGKVYDMNFKFMKNLTKKEIELIEKITFKTAKRAGYLW